MTGMQAFAVILGLVGLVFALWGLFKASLGSPPAEIAKRLELVGSLSMAEVAEWMGVKPEAVKRWIASGLLRVMPRRRDQPYRIAWPDVKSFHDERRVAVSQGGFFR